MAPDLMGRIGRSRRLLKFLLVKRLGLINIIRVIRHRLRLRNHSYERALPEAAVPMDAGFWVHGQFRKALAIDPVLQVAILERADEIVAGSFRRFEDELIFEGSSPQWHKLNYADSKDEHFSRVKLNEIPGADVKLCWDISRFKWVTQLALAASCSTDEDRRRQYQERSAELLRSWVADNGYFKGVNWACGQEVSIRGLHLMVSTCVYDAHFSSRPVEGLLALLTASYERVKLTIDYSLAQDNNHSLTESLFLYFSLHYLQRHGVSVATPGEDAKNLRRLQRVMARLIQRDGSFAMYSVNYHRAVCDILSLSKVIDEALDISFWLSNANLAYVKDMHAFLSMLVDPVSGGAPNIGHNDGSLHAIQFTSFGDYAPSVVFMGAVFSLPVDEVFRTSRNKVYCFGHEAKFVETPKRRLSHFDCFGLVVATTASYRAFFKYPKNKFRPQQLDFLHLDLWVRGANVLRDSGSYSYNPEDPTLIEFFDDAPAHNVPFLVGERFIARLSRFLYLEWPSSKVEISDSLDQIEVSARMNNLKGQSFVRTLEFSAKHILISDQGPGNSDWSVAYNLCAVPVESGANTVIASGVSMEFDAPVNTTSSFYSTRYLDKQVGARLVVSARGSTLLTTKVSIQEQP